MELVRIECSNTRRVPKMGIRHWSFVFIRRVSLRTIPSYSAVYRSPTAAFLVGKNVNLLNTAVTRRW